MKEYKTTIAAVRANLNISEKYRNLVKTRGREAPAKLAKLSDRQKQNLLIRLKDKTLPLSLLKASGLNEKGVTELLWRFIDYTKPALPKYHRIDFTIDYSDIKYAGLTRSKTTPPHQVVYFDTNSKYQAIRALKFNLEHTAAAKAWLAKTVDEKKNRETKKQEKRNKVKEFANQMAIWCEAQGLETTVDHSYSSSYIEIGCGEIEFKSTMTRSIKEFGETYKTTKSVSTSTLRFSDHKKGDSHFNHQQDIEIVYDAFPVHLTAKAVKEIKAEILNQLAN